MGVPKGPSQACAVAILQSTARRYKKKMTFQIPGEIG
jgi:hypothetical protein